MIMQSRWLTAPEYEVATAMASVRRDSRPKWVPTRRQVLVHVNHCLILWYLCIVFMTVGVRVDVFQDGQVSTSDLGDLVVAMAILAVWFFGSFLLHRWAARPPSPRTRLKEWRQTLTALANGFEYRPNSDVTFTSMVTSAPNGVRGHPRFVAPGVEFGNLKPRAGRSGEWHYLAVKLPAVLPHLILDATSNDGIVSDLPGRIDRAQRLSLEGDFDRWFTVYAPVTYESDALYFLTPDVMAAFIDTASGYNIEIIDDSLVFFAPSAVDFATPGPWHSIQEILVHAASRIVGSARRYRDERVPGQDIAPVISSIRAALAHPDVLWVAPQPLIGPDGRRLDIRVRNYGLSSVLGAIAWFGLLTFLYAVPGIFAFAGFMSIIDGR
ncbi:MAG: hypothetical protein ABWX56_00555 [Mycetocola sp.]